MSAKMMPKAHARDIAMLAGELAEIALDWKARAMAAEDTERKFAAEIYSSPTIEEAVSDRLIAAAPAMLEALERIQDEANTVCGDWRETASLIDSLCIAAIALARGDAQ